VSLQPDTPRIPFPLSPTEQLLTYTAVNPDTRPERLDPTDAVIPAVTVKATNLATRIPYRTLTNNTIATTFLVVRAHW
jgi:hypothetical protein